MLRAILCRLLRVINRTKFQLVPSEIRAAYLEATGKARGRTPRWQQPETKYVAYRSWAASRSRTRMITSSIPRPSPSTEDSCALTCETTHKNGIMQTKSASSCYLCIPAPPNVELSGGTAKSLSKPLLLQDISSLHAGSVPSARIQGYPAARRKRHRRFQVSGCRCKCTIVRTRISSSSTVKKTPYGKRLSMPRLVS